MSSSARIATLLLLAIHLAGVSAPCATVKLPAAPHFAELAGDSAHPCPSHRATEDAPSTWLDALCPCGCESGPPPGNGVSRTGPALLVANLATPDAPDRGAWTPSPAQPADAAAAPPDHVPLAIA